MGCRGVHFAITSEQADQLLAADDDEELVGLVEAIEEEWDAAYETDKAWDALHRCLSNGTLNVLEGEPPLNRAFFGGKVLNEDDEYFVVLVTPAEVREVAAALGKVSESWLRSRYFDLSFPDYQGEKSEEDWGYTWSHFQGLPEFFAQAAKNERHVIFTVDQ
jgi:hypothetical protein